MEWHLGMISVAEALFKETPSPVGGVLTVPDVPGLGYELDADVVKDTRVDCNPGAGIPRKAPKC